MGTKWITADVITFARMNQKTLIVQAAEPAVMYEGMMWFDTDIDQLYQRNSANTGWYTAGRNRDLVDPPSDHSYTGDTITDTAGENVAIGDLCYEKNDGKFWLADADAEATAKGMLVLATEAIAAEASGVFLVYGKYRDDTWNWTVGQELYIHTTGGNPTGTKPSGSGDIIRIIGHGHTADILFFNPDQTYVEHA